MVSLLSIPLVSSNWVFWNSGYWDKISTKDTFYKEFSHKMKMSSLGINSGSFFFEKKGIYYNKFEDYTLVYNFEDKSSKNSYLNVTMNDDHWVSIDEGYGMDYVFIVVNDAIEDDWTNVTGKVVEKEGEFKLREPPIMYAKEKNKNRSLN